MTLRQIDYRGGARTFQQSLALHRNRVHGATLLVVRERVDPSEAARGSVIDHGSLCVLRSRDPAGAAE